MAEMPPAASSNHTWPSDIATVCGVVSVHGAIGLCAYLCRIYFRINSRIT